MLNFVPQIKYLGIKYFLIWNIKIVLLKKMDGPKFD